MNKEKHSVAIDDADLNCPIILERYTEQNYPVILLCGHTLSIQGFNQISGLHRRCPTCGKAAPVDYIPLKNNFLSQAADQVRTNKDAICFNHPQERAVAICFKDKAFLCPDCLLDDKHRNDKVMTLKKLNSYLRDKKDALIGLAEKKVLNDNQFKEISDSIMTRLEPLIQKRVRTDLKEYNIKSANVSDIVRKVDCLLESNLTMDSIEVVEEIDTEIKKFESTNPQADLQKDIDKVTTNVIDLFLCSSEEEKQKTEKSLSIFIQDEEDWTEFVGLDNKRKFAKLHLRSRIKFDIKLFTQELCQFKRLNALELDFTDCNSIDDAGLKELSQVLKNMTSLTNLNIQFTVVMFSSLFGCRSISDTGVKELSLALKSMTSLTTLNLGLARCSSISDAGFKELCQAIGSNRSILYFRLNFDYCLGEERKAELESLQEILRLRKNLAYMYSP